MRADSLFYPRKKFPLPLKNFPVRPKIFPVPCRQGICLQSSEIFGIFCTVFWRPEAFFLVLAANREFFPCSTPTDFQEPKKWLAGPLNGIQAGEMTEADFSLG
jgi:hypothetical protein